jgi:hypothetical protein
MPCIVQLLQLLFITHKLCCLSIAAMITGACSDVQALYCQPACHGVLYQWAGMAASSPMRKALIDAIIAYGRSNQAQTYYEEHEQQQHGSVVVSIQDAAFTSKLDDQPQTESHCLRDDATGNADGPVHAGTGAVPRGDCSSKAAAAPLPAVPAWASFNKCKALSVSCKGSIGAKFEVPRLALDSARPLSGGVHHGVTQPRLEEIVHQLAALSTRGTPAAQRLLAVGKHTQTRC